MPRTIGRYTVQRVLGRGGMGTVYLATDPRIDREVAIKVLPAAGGEAYADRLLAEARVSGRLVHPHIVGVYDVGDDDGQLFVVMPYIEGRTLASVITDAARPPLAVKLEWMAQLCDGLAYAHERRVIHRDIKPSNLLIDDRGALRVLDFGIAKVLTTSQIQFTSVGTPAYMAPEQYSSAPVDPRTDVFSAGLVFYELLTHRRALTGTTPAQIYGQLMAGAMPRVVDAAPDVDPAIAEVCERAMSREPGDRFQTARAFADALHAARVAKPPAVDSTAATVVAVNPGLATTAQMARTTLPRVSEPGTPSEPVTDGAASPPNRVVAEILERVRELAEPESEIYPASGSGPAPEPKPERDAVDPRTVPNRARMIVVGVALAGAVAAGLWAAFSHVPAEAPPGAAAIPAPAAPELRRRPPPDLHGFTGTGCKSYSSSSSAMGDPATVFHFTWSCTPAGEPDRNTTGLLRQSTPAPVTLWTYAKPESEYDNWYVASADASTVLVGEATGWTIVHAEDGRVIRKLSPVPGHSPRLSHDGLALLYHTHSPRLSGDGRTLRLHTAELRLLDVASGEVRTIAVPLEGDRSLHGTLSATGRFVVVVTTAFENGGVDGLRSPLYRYDRLTGSLLVVNEDIGTPGRSLVPQALSSADGDWIVYSAWRPVADADPAGVADGRAYLYAYRVSTGRTTLLDSVARGTDTASTTLQPLGIIDSNIVVSHRDRGPTFADVDFVWTTLPIGTRATVTIERKVLEETNRYPEMNAPRCLSWPDRSAWCVDP